MIIDRTWNKKDKKLVISYTGPNGERKFYQKYLNFIKTYEYAEDGEFPTWNGKRCNAVYKDTSNYSPNQFDFFEFMYELPDDIQKELHATYAPKIYFYDIETEVSPTNEFPDPTKAEQRVSAISLVGSDLSCIVYGIKNMTPAQLELFKKHYLDWVHNNEFANNVIKTQGYEPKVLFQAFDSEEKLLEHWFNIIIPKICCLCGWNSNRFDWMYLTNRIKRLFGEQKANKMIRTGSPTYSLKNITFKEMDGTSYRIPAPAHALMMDYMELVKKYDTILAPYESYKLDYVGTRAVNAQKIKYEGTLQQLWERDTEWYYFYNAVDSCIGQLIHKRLKCLEAPAAVSAVTLVPVYDALGQIVLTEANMFEQFYLDGMKIVWDYDAVPRYRADYEGAFVGCISGRFEFTVCDDFASLYPSQIQTCNLSFENQVVKMEGPDSFGRYVKAKWSEEELENFRKDPNYFVTVMGNVYKNDKEYAFKKMQRRTKQNRDKYKYTGQLMDSELLVEIDRLIKEKSNETEKIA